MSESEGARHALLQAIPDLIFRFDADGTFLDCVPTPSIPLLAHPDVFLGRRVDDVLTEDHAARALEHIRHTLSSGTTCAHEYALWLDDTRRHFEARYSPVSDNEVIALVRDVTYQRWQTVERDALNAISSLFLDCQALAPVWERVPGILSEKFDYPVAAVELYDRPTDHMVFVGSVGLPRRDDGPVRIPCDQTISGTVVKSGEPVIAADIERRPDYALPGLRALGVRGFVCVPMRNDGRVIGTVVLAHTRVCRVPPSLPDTLQLVADFLARVIDHFWAQEGVRQRQVRLRLLNDIAIGITSRMTIEEIVRSAIGQIYDDFPTLRVAYSTIDAHGQLSVLTSAQPEGMSAIAGMSADLTAAPEYLAGLRSEEPVIVEDVSSDDRMTPLRDAMAAGGTGAFVDVPVRHSDEVIGILCFDAPRPKCWSEHELTTLSEAAAYLAIAIRGARSERELSEHRSRLGTFDEISKVILSTLDIDAILDILGREIVEAGYFRSLMIATVDEEADAVTVVRSLARAPDGSVDKGAQNVLGTRYDLADPNITAVVARTGEMAVLTGWDDRFDSEFTELDTYPPQKVAYFIPVKRRDRVLAVLATASDERDKQSVLHRIEAMSPLLAQTAVALDHARLFHRTRTAREELHAVVSCARCLLWHATVERREPDFPAGRYLHWDLQSFNEDAAQQFLPLDVAPGSSYLQAWYEAKLPEDDGPMYETAKNALMGGESRYRQEFRCRDRHGALRWLEEDVFVEKLEPDRWRLVGVCTDITDRKASEQELHAANERLGEAVDKLRQTQEQALLNERLRALGHMASGIAHDFNNALTPILGFSELLLTQPDELEDTAVAREYLDMIHTTAEDARHIVRRLRDFYRARGDDEAHSHLDLRQIIAEAISLTQPKWKDEAQALGASVRVHTDLADTPHVLGEASELREMLTNLILNACDAMPTGGSITIRTYVETGAESTPAICLSIRDTGIGMSEEVRRRCLEPFFTTKSAHGTGLGLAMVYGILRRHDATVDIESAEGVGTTITLSFPTAYDELPREDEPTPAQPAAPLRVLVVDDEPVVRKLIGAYLVSDGHGVVSVSSGEDAITECERQMVDLVVTDRAMPEMSGDRLADIIKERFPGTPVVMVTGFGPLMHHRPESVDAILAKPVTRGELQGAIAEVTSEDRREAGSEHG
ncbi:GAF domain-containing protein [Candidatus Poribacteria bacterium]|nr:GAF domain-containing protein [Candidatus Poribacteria bacterium]MBT7806384.1 GAF domain-containing protein [Candidatus Poribacteria bacterium]